MSLTHNRPIAEDLLQEAFARVWASPKTPAEPEAFKRWLYRAILNLARDQARRRTRWSRLRFWSAPPPDPLDEVEKRANDAELALALRSLAPREQAALHLRFFEDQSFQQMAQTLGISEDHARVVVHRALAKLRRHLMPQRVVGGAEA